LRVPGSRASVRWAATIAAASRVWAFRATIAFTRRSQVEKRPLWRRRHHPRLGRRTSATPRTHASRRPTRTTGSSRPCDRRPARDRVGDPRCCSRWECNSGPVRKPAYEAIVGAGRQPSLLSVLAIVSSPSAALCVCHGTKSGGWLLLIARSDHPGRGRPSYVHTDRRSSRRRSIASRRPVPGPAATGCHKPLRAVLESFGHPGQPGQT
jgi:hypothetical protein